MGQAEVMQALDVTGDDLAENQLGRLSARQRERLGRIQTRNTWIGLGAVVVLLIVSMLLLYFGAARDSLILRLIGFGVVACNAAVLAVWLRGRLRLTADLERGTVREVGGLVGHTIRVTGQVAIYVLTVAEEEFQVSKPVFLALPKNARCRLYVTPEARVLVGAEVA